MTWSWALGRGKALHMVVGVLLGLLAGAYEHLWCMEHCEMAAHSSKRQATPFAV